MPDTVLSYKSGIIAARLDSKEKVLVENVCFDLREGDSIALIGETGSGKTIIANSIMRLLSHNIKSSGSEIYFLGKDLLKEKHIKNIIGDEIVYIPQSGHESLNPSRKIYSQFLDTLKKNKFPKDKHEEMVKDALKKVGFLNPLDIMDKYPFEISGGMAQRVVIAMAICSHAKLIIADEPTNGLDKRNEEEFLKLFDDIFVDKAKIIITHDIDVARIANKIIVLNKGKVMEEGDALSILDSPRHPYTKALISAMPSHGLNIYPRLRNKTKMCPFYDRCPIAKDTCVCGAKEHRDEKARWFCNETDS